MSIADNCWGEIVTIDSFTKGRKYTAVQQVLENHGFPANFCAPVRASTAFRRSCEQAYGWKFTITHRNKHVTVGAYSRTTRDRNRAEVLHVATVRFDSRTNKVTCDDNSRIATKIQGLLTSAIERRNPADLLELAKRIMNEGGDVYSLTEQARAWFVPIEFIKNMDRAEACIASLGSTIRRFYIMKGPAPNRGNMQHTVRACLERSTRGLAEALAGHTQITSLHVREQTKYRLQSLKAQAERAELQVGIELRDVILQLDQLLENVSQVIQTLRTEKAQTNDD